jgi:hypothetical protein
MAVPTNTRETYGAVGIREDLSDIIYNISPTDTPFLNGVGKGTASNTLFEWQTDDLDAAAANRRAEGDDPTSIAVSEPTRLSNYTQISSKTVQSSGTAEAVDFAGRKSTQAYQLAKRAKEIKRDMETMLLDTTVKAAGSSGSARATGAYQSWVGTGAAGTSNVLDGDGTGLTNAADGSSVATTVTAGAISLALINSVIKRIWDLGGSPDTIMTSGTKKQAISALGSSVVADLQTNTSGAVPATAINAVDVLVTDFGTFKLVPNRFCTESCAYIVDFDMWSVDYLRPFKTETLAKTGDSIKQMMIAEYGLRAKNGNGSGLIMNLS